MDCFSHDAVAVGISPSRGWRKGDHRAGEGRGLGEPNGQPLLIFLAWLRSESEVAMPTYEYRCSDCRHVFDRIESLAEHGVKKPACPKCHSRNVEQVLTAFFAKTSHKA